MIMDGPSHFQYDDFSYVVVYSVSGAPTSPITPFTLSKARDFLEGGLIENVLHRVGRSYSIPRTKMTKFFIKPFGPPVPGTRTNGVTIFSEFPPPFSQQTTPCRCNHTERERIKNHPSAAAALFHFPHTHRVSVHSTTYPMSVTKWIREREREREREKERERESLIRKTMMFTPTPTKAKPDRGAL